MSQDFAAISALPSAYWLVALTLLALVIEAAIRLREQWAAPALMVYFTIFAWYMIEPAYSPDTMAEFSIEILNSSYFAIFLFLSTFRLSCSFFASVLKPKHVKKFNIDDFPVKKLFKFTFYLWVVLLLIGTARMDWDFGQALLPISGRAGNLLWLRAAGADAGPFGFLISSAFYVYIITLAIFGMVFWLLPPGQMKLWCLLAILISWPYVFLQGSRNSTLFVIVPSVFSFLYYSRYRLSVKFAGLMSSIIFTDWSFRKIIEYRDIGFDKVSEADSVTHLGLNMASELSYCISFIQSGVLRETMGLGLLTEIVRFVPRSIWPGKPLFGIEYAIARGFSGGSSDIGVNATISTGIIGQGVLEFGVFWGPVSMGISMAIWTGLLARFWAQGTVARVCLFLIGIGLTFNLGRNVVMITLWPMVFAYVGVLLAEYLTKKPSPSLPLIGEHHLPNIPAE